MIAAIDPRIAWTLGGIAALLVVATGALWALRRAYPQRDWRELSDRIKSWWVLALIFGVSIALSRLASLIFLGVMMFLALKEYLSMIPTRRADRKVLAVAYLAIPVEIYWIASERYGFFLIWIPVYLFLLIPAMMLLVGQTKGFLRAAGSLHWGLMICVFMLGHAAYLLVLPDRGYDAPGGAGWLLFLVLTTQINDVAQYLTGKRFGRTPVAPSVSPGKTVEGFLGGMAASVVLAVALAPLLTPMDTPTALLAGAIIGIAGFFGDLTVSMLKRDLGVKDAGTLLPGHGGVLDRLDSLAFAAPLFFHYVVFLFYRG